MPFRTISTFSCDIAYSAQPDGFEGLLAGRTYPTSRFRRRASP